MIKPITFLFIFLSLSFAVLGQPDDVNLKKVTTEELEMQNCSFDSSAHAMVLFDEGKIRFVLDKRSGTDFNYLLERHVRIKIFDEEGYDHATFEIPIYARGGDREKISGIKGRTYNLDNGQIEDTKLEKDAIYEDEYSKRLTLIKFTFPNVKPGSIIDLEYTINSDYLFSLQDWEFQGELPVLWSRFYAKIPSIFRYNTAVLGYAQVNALPTEKVNEIYGNATMPCMAYDWNVYKLPGIPEEEMISSMNNYRTNLQFELAEIETPTYKKSFANNWGEVVQGLEEDEDFGGFIKNANFPLDEKISDAPYSLQKAKDIFEAVKHGFSWNGTNQFYAKQTTKQALDTRKANTSEINLMLCGTLQKQGFNAFPVLLSTRKNGMFITYSYRVTQFNYVITAVQVDTMWYLLDATEDILPFGYLPPRCLNNNGLKVHSQYFSVMSIKTNDAYKINANRIVNLNANGAAQVEEKETILEHAAYRFREFYFEEEEEEFASRIKKSEPEKGYSDISVEHAENLEKPIVFTAKYETDGLIVDAGNTKILSLASLFHITENPFSEEKRILPIEYQYPAAYTYLIQINIPEGYEIGDIPAPTRLVTENSGIVFTYQITKMGNSLHIMARFKRDRTTFLVEEYPTIRHFYSQYLSKISEPIELIAQ